MVYVYYKRLNGIRVILFIIRGFFQLSMIEIVLLFMLPIRLGVFLLHGKEVIHFLIHRQQEIPVLPFFSKSAQERFLG